MFSGNTQIDSGFVILYNLECIVPEIQNTEQLKRPPKANAYSEMIVL